MNNSLELQIDDKNSEMQSLLSEIDGYTQSLQFKDNQLEELSNTLEAKNKDIEVLKENIKSSSSELSEKIQSLGNEIAEKDQKISEFDAIRAGDQNKINELTASLKELDNQFQTKEFQITNLNSEISTLQTKVKQYEIKEADHVRNLNELKEQVTTAVNQKKEISELYSDVENKHKNYKKHIAALEQNLIDRDRTILELSSDEAVDQTEIEKRLSEKSTKVEELQRVVIDLEEQLEILNKGYTETTNAQESEMQYIIQQLDERNKELEQKEDELAAHKESIKQFESLAVEKGNYDEKMQLLNDNIQDITLELSLRNEEKNILEEENKVLNKKLEELELGLPQNTAGDSEQQEQINELNLELDNLKNQLKNQESILTEKEREYDHINSELSKLLDAKEDTNEREQFLTQRIKDLESTIDKFESEKTAFDIEITSKEEQEEAINTLTNEVVELKEKLTEYEAELKEKQNFTEQLTAQIESAHLEKENAVEYNNDSNAKIESLENELAKLNELKITYEKELADKSKNVAELKELVEKSNLENNPNSDIIEEYENKLVELENELVNVKESSGNYTSIIDEKNSIIEEQGKRLSQVKLEKTDKEIEFIKLKEQLEDYKNEIEKLSSTKNNYMVETNKSLEETQKFRTLNENLEKELKTKSVEEESLKVKIAEQSDLIGDLQKRLDSIEISSKENITETPTFNTPNNTEDNLDPDPTFSNEIEEENSNNDIDFSFNPFEMGSETESPDNSELENESNVYKGAETKNTDKFAPFIEKRVQIEEDEVEVPEEQQHTEFAHLLYGNVSVVSVNVPRATMDIASKFKTFLNGIIDGGNTKMIIDLAECEFVDSTVLGVLVSSLKRAMSNDGDVRIVWGDNTESSMFYITRMDKVFKLFDNLEDAIQSYLGE